MKVKDFLRKLLEEKEVEEVLAPVRNPAGGQPFPRFLSDPREIEEITLDGQTPISMAKFLVEFGERGRKTAALVRTCDARALVELAKREQADLDNILIIGVECPGEGIAETCRYCEYTVPSVADVTFYENGGASLNTEKGRKLISILEALGIPEVERRETPPERRERALRVQEEEFSSLWNLPPRERLSFWLSLLDRCIKCYGCRDACPLCVCKECYLEPQKLVVMPGGNPPDKLFHLIRLIHVADSCVGCGRCELVCPMNIPLTKLYQMLHKELEKIFAYIPGLDLAALPPLVCFTEEERRKTGVDLD